jgi:putative transposase
LYRKQENLAREMHYLIIKFLTSRYNWILLPSFETQEMVKGYNLRAETKREASQLQHYKFKTRLLSVCQQIHNCKTVIVSEAYTSKTCGWCGVLKENLTLKDRIFKCDSCGAEADRDVHAARNIFLRNTTKLTVD